MADWPAPDPQAWQPPAPVTSQSMTSQPEQPQSESAQPESAQPESAEWTPPTWEELVRDHGARVYRLAYRLTGNPHDAEDLTQDVFVRVFRSLHRFQPGTFEGWLHRITTNLFLDGARRTKLAIHGERTRGAGRRFASTVWVTVPTSGCPVPGPTHPSNWLMPTWTTTLLPRSQPYHRSFGRPSCCAISRA